MPNICLVWGSGSVVLAVSVTLIFPDIRACSSRRAGGVEVLHVECRNVVGDCLCTPAVGHKLHRPVRCVVTDHNVLSGVADITVGISLIRVAAACGGTGQVGANPQLCGAGNLKPYEPGLPGSLPACLMVRSTVSMAVRALSITACTSAW